MLRNIFSPLPSGERIKVRGNVLKFFPHPSPLPKGRGENSDDFIF